MNVFSQFVEQQLAAPASPARAPTVQSVSTPGQELELRTLKHITTHANQDVREIASMLGVQPPQLYGILNRLQRKGQILATGRIGNCNIWKAVRT